MPTAPPQAAESPDNPTASSASAPHLARLGVLVGICGWAIGILVFAAFTGAIGDLWLPGLTCLSLSFVGGVGFIVGGEAIARRLAGPSFAIARRCAIGGAFLAFTSMVCLLSTHWLVPIIEQHPAFAAIYRFQRVPDSVSLALAVAGAGLLTPAARELFRVKEPTP